MKIDDLSKDLTGTWAYNRQNTIKNILDFEHILNYTKPVKRIDDRMAHILARAGGSIRRS